MELRQLGDEHTHQGHSVEDEVDLVVLGVEAGEEVPGGRGDTKIRVPEKKWRDKPRQLTEHP